MSDGATLTLFSAFLMGLLGSAHCVGMCGGIVGALTLGLREEIRCSPGRLFPYLLSYNSGRILSYVAAGALAGLVGAQLGKLLPTQGLHIGFWISGIFMIALGLYLGGWWQALAVLEKWGSRLWRYIQPLGRGLMPVRHPGQALGLGLVWGWLPCGTVYTALVWAFVSGGALQGGLLMLAFGLGTLPMLLAIGTIAHWLVIMTRRLWVRRSAGAVIIGFGVYTLLQAANLLPSAVP